jgi:hypothetical protein
LYRIRLELPEDDPIVLQGVPTRINPGPTDNLASIGIRVLGHEERWERFVGALQTASVRRIRVSSVPPETSTGTGGTR